MTATQATKVVGQRLPKLNASEFVRGTAQYTADIRLPGMLFARLLRSPYAHARIKRIDSSKALALKGVKAVITAADFPLDSIPPGVAGTFKMVMASDKALYHGQPVAAVAAEDPFTAAEALGLIDVEYEELPLVLTVDQALSANAPIIDQSLRTKDATGAAISSHPSNAAMRAESDRGSVDKGFAEAEVVAEGTYEISRAHQGYLEPQACLAAVEPGGRVMVWTSSQGGFTTQGQIAAILGLPRSSVRVTVPEVGGAFGGKIFSIIEPVAVVLAQRTGQPVKLVLSREEVLRATGPGAGGRFHVRVGCKRDGTITAMSFEAWLDVGCCTPEHSASYVLLLVGAPYGKIPHLRIIVHEVLTNRPGLHPYRAPLSPQVYYAMEQVIDEAARTLGMDPVAFRLKNASEEGDPRPEGTPFNRIGLKPLLQRIMESKHYNTPIGERNRGRGLALGYWPNFAMLSTTHVSISPDGTAAVTVGSVDLSGTRGVFQQIAAEELGLRPEQVTVTMGDTDTVGLTEVSGGSRTAYTMGTAVSRACQEVIAQAKSRAARRLGVQVEAVDHAEGKFFAKDAPNKKVSWSDVAVAPDGVLEGRSSVSQLAGHPAFSAGLADVEVDPDTGKVRLLRYTAFQDVGKALNPTRVEAQIQAGTAQGVGWALSEEYRYSSAGAVLNATLLDYRMPTALDLPFIEVQLLEVPSPEGPYGARGVGEAPIVPPLPTLANAFYAATGKRQRAAPMTPERVLQALRTSS
ncbi:MAG: xanthine dehydrogenase family protein molybdopterin-binding subunit [Chloroflexi bacterium]|nr:xanthine dehydrogenase family protein molybdopterin-binding subunit [Chloroflexota bacterium]